MRRICHIFIPILFVAMLLGGCAGKARLIPRGKLADIYAEMYLADQWLSLHPEHRPLSDSTLSYVPILRSYGYTLEDYRYSVDHYLLDPERFGKMMVKVSDQLGKRSAQLSKAVGKRDAIRQVLEKFDDYVPEVQCYDSLFMGVYNPFRIDIRMDSTRRYVIHKVIPDTVLRGPELIPGDRWLDMQASAADDSMLAAEADTVRKKPRVRLDKAEAQKMRLPVEDKEVEL